MCIHFVSNADGLAVNYQKTALSFVAIVAVIWRVSLPPQSFPRYSYLLTTMEGNDEVYRAHGNS